MRALGGAVVNRDGQRISPSADTLHEWSGPLIRAARTVR
jgi:hypothetical protein